jgi:P-type Cu+ transporter
MKNPLQLSVAGMKCQKCVAKLTSALSGIEGISAVVVDLDRRSASCEYDTALIDASGIAAVVAASGFRVEAEPVAAVATAEVPPESATSRFGAAEQLQFGIRGMSCANCAQTIEKKLKTLPGLVSVQINLATETGQIGFDPAQLSAERIHDAVAAAGYRAVPLENAAEDALQARRQRQWLLFSALFSLPIMPLMWFAPLAGNTIYLILLLATVVQFSAGLTFYVGSWKALKNRTANMDVLVALGISAAYGYSLLALAFDLGSMFFETGAMLITFIRFGKWLEARAKGKAGAALRSLLQLQADRARLLVDGQEREVPASQIQPGDLLVVRPGDTIPVDGLVVEGTAAVDESLVSGESLPVEKSPGSEVTGTTINRSGRLLIKATRVGQETVLARIVQLVAEAQADKAPIQRLADTVSNYFVPAVVLLAVATFLAWYLLAAAPFLFAFQLAIAVLVIACPCALGLATPTAIMVGSAVGLQQGLLFKRASSLENVARLDVLLLDKTGTLTQGRFSVTEVVALPGPSRREVLQLAASAEQHSNHPLAEAVVAQARAEQLELLSASGIEEQGGLGVRCSVAGQPLLVGNRRFVEQTGISVPDATELEPLVRRGDSLVYLCRDGQLSGVIALADTLQDGAAEAVRSLRQLGLKTVMVTGDRQAAAEQVAGVLGIDEFRAEVLPGDKLEVVKEYQSQGLLVGMVGDGINDAPALAQADIGIAIGSGTDVARETGDIVLIGQDIRRVVMAIRLGRKTLGKIKQNLFWAFVYNLLGLPLAAGLLYPAFGLLLKPEFAGLAMAFSSVSVVSNSLLLKRQGKQLQL